MQNLGVWISIVGAIVALASIVTVALSTRNKFWSDRVTALTARVTELEKELERKDGQIEKLENDCRQLREEVLVLMRKLLLGDTPEKSNVREIHPKR